MPRKALLARHAAEQKRSEDARKAAAASWSGHQYHPRLIFDGGPTYHSTTPIAQLRPIALKELSAPARHEGRVLVLRTLTAPVIYVGCTLVVEDAAGDAIPLSISHFSANLKLSPEELAALLPVGTLLAIREPYISTNHLSRAGPASGKGAVGIRVDTPSDVHVLEQEELQALFGGAAAFPAMEHQAQEDSVEDRARLRWLEDGLGGSWQRSGMLKDKQSARSLIHQLREHKRPGAARRSLHAFKQLSPDPDPEFDALECEILLDCRDFTECGEKLERLQSVDAALRETLDRKQSEAERGPSSEAVAAFYQQIQRDATPRLDSTDFVGPVAVRDIEGAGRGLVLTRDVKPGELLLCCKAIGGSHAEDEGCSGVPVLRLNLENGVISTTTQILAATNMIHTLLDQPNLALPFLGLTAGPSIPYSEYVSQPYPLRWSCAPPSEPETQRIDVSAEYVEGVLRFNAFGPGRITSQTSGGARSNVPTAEGELGRSTMPHPLPAILNHSCLPNVSSVFFADVVTTRALHHLPAGTEIMHQYVRGEQHSAIRQAQLSKHAFVCRCALCDSDRADGTERLQRRQRLMGGTLPTLLERSRLVQKGMGGGDGLDAESVRDAIQALEALAAQVEETYAPDRALPKPDVVAIWTEVAKLHASIDDGDAAIKAHLRGLAALGVIPRAQAEVPAGDERCCDDLPMLSFDAALASALSIADFLLKAGEKKAARSWAASAYWWHQCMINGGFSVFLDRWGEDGKVAGKYADVLELLQADLPAF